MGSRKRHAVRLVVRQPAAICDDQCGPEPDGSVVSRELWDAPYCSEVHDMWLTPDWMVLPFQGFTFDPDRVKPWFVGTGVGA